MTIKVQRVALLEAFHHTAKTKFNKKRADMFDRVINSLNEDTATPEHKNCPYKISPLISLQSRVELNALEITLRTGGVTNA